MPGPQPRAAQGSSCSGKLYCSQASQPSCCRRAAASSHSCRILVRKSLTSGSCRESNSWRPAGRRAGQVSAGAGRGAWPVRKGAWPGWEGVVLVEGRGLCRRRGPSKERVEVLIGAWPCRFVGGASSGWAGPERRWMERGVNGAGLGQVLGGAESRWAGQGASKGAEPERRAGLSKVWSEWAGPGAREAR